MDKVVYEKRLPQLSVVLPMSSTKDDAKEAAHDLISNGMEISNFEILHVEFVGEGQFRSRGSMVTGKRYIVAFEQLQGEVVFIHPNYDEIMGQ